MTKLSKAQTNYRQGNFAHHCGNLGSGDHGDCIDGAPWFL
jgi:hypothetical protein